jgi:hypothetical protein
MSRKIKINGQLVEFEELKSLKSDNNYKDKKWRYTKTGDVEEVTNETESADDIIFSGNKSSLRRIADLERNISVLATKVLTLNSSLGYDSDDDNFSQIFDEDTRVKGDIFRVSSDLFYVDSDVDVDFNGTKITQVGAPSALTDAATKGYVDTSISNLVNGANASFDTLKEIQDAMATDTELATAINNLSIPSNTSDLTNDSGFITNTADITGNVTGTVSDISNHSINALSDVDTTTATPTEGQAMVWDSVDSIWKPGDISFSGADPSITVDAFVGNGSTTNFTITTAPDSAKDIIVTLDGLIQRPTTDYTVTGRTLTFNTAPYNGAVIASRLVAANAGSNLAGNVTIGTDSTNTISVNGVVSIGSSSAASSLDISSRTDAIILPKGTTAQRPESPVTGMIRYNTDLGLIEQYNSNGWQAIDAPPTISGISGIINEDTDSTITITGSNFKSGSVIKIEGAGVSNTPRSLVTTYVNSTTLTANTNATSVNYIGGQSFSVTVLNPSGLFATLESAGAVDRDPVWVTSSGSLGSGYNGYSINFSASATDADSDTITYSLQSGSLPPGVSFNTSTGAFTGTPSGVSTQSTYPVTVRATANGVNIDRSFSFTIKDPNNPLNIISAVYPSPDYQTGGSGTFPEKLFDDECAGGGLVHAQADNSESACWIVIAFEVPVRINQARIQARNHSAQYLGNWKFYRDNTGGNGDSITSYNGLSGWSTVMSASSYEPGTCEWGSWISASSNQGFSKHWMLTTFGNNRGAYESFSQLDISYDIQV